MIENDTYQYFTIQMDILFPIYADVLTVAKGIHTKANIIEKIQIEIMIQVVCLFPACHEVLRGWQMAIYLKDRQNI